MTTVTVITATYNAASVLPALLASLRAQTWRDFEFIVIDGASTDATVELLRASGDIVTRWISEPDFGVYDALNKAIRLATGEYYLVVGADDELDAGALERYLAAANTSGADVISAPIWANGRLLRAHRRFSWLSVMPPGVSGHSVGALIRRQLHDELGLYSRKLPIAADTFFLAKVQTAGKQFFYLDEPAGTFGTAGLSSADPLGTLTESMRANVYARGNWPLHFVLFLLRVVRHAPRLLSTSSKHGRR